jgi:hypothetical protein
MLCITDLIRVLYERINPEECAKGLPFLLALSELIRRESRETSRTRLYDILIQIGHLNIFQLLWEVCFSSIKKLAKYGSNSL